MVIQEVLDTLPENLKQADFSILHASQVVEMNEKPSDILRQKKDSSIQVACRLVKEGEAQAVISVHALLRLCLLKQLLVLF